MNDVIIRATNLTKIYRLYSNSQYRLLDMVGLLRNDGKRFTEHTALAGINLEIRRGEKVAIIGRNGAGKSTLLKLISNLIPPTSGVLEVRGNARALLQIGSGFHPDFSGRENVYGYLAQLGVYGNDAAAKLVDVIEFAELEEYIDQPLKTYSTGMAVRLMFATSTVVAPDVLILDEVLSVGDAYFAHKSFERIKELSLRHQTTLLLVSHEIYSAARLCERLIWLDHGEILLDGDGPTVLTAYEDSIRHQEEQRLRKKKQDRLAQIGKDLERNKFTDIIIEFRSANNIPPKCPIYFSSIELSCSGAPPHIIPLDATTMNEADSHLQVEASNWGMPTTWQGRESRPMQNFGTSFHKAAAIFRFPSVPDIEQATLGLSVEYWSDSPNQLVLRAFWGGKQFDLGPLPQESGKWRHHAVSWQLNEAGASSRSEMALRDLSFHGVHGSGRIGIADLRLTNREGEEAHIFSHGCEINFQIQFSVRDPHFDATAQILLALHKDGIVDVCRFVTGRLHFEGSIPDGTIELNVPKLSLANGRYSVSVMIAKDGYFDRDQFMFYSINPDVHVCVSRITEFDVIGGGPLGSGTMFVAEGTWSLVQAQAARPVTS